MNADSTIKSVSVMLAAAYWRGRLYGMRSDNGDRTIEEMIGAAARNDASAWEASAKVALSDVIHPQNAMNATQ